MKKRYELVIIGAGPAGSYAALTAARNGLDVLLLERSPRVGLPLACAEGISHDGLSKFIEPDLRFISSKIDSLGFNVATGFNYIYRFEQCVGYVLDRPTFDAYLAQRAVDYGACLQTSAYACGLELKENKPARVTVSTENGMVDITADYVIAADGVESMIGRMVGLDTALELEQTDSSLQYRVSGIEVDPRCLHFFVGQKYSPGGYLWVFPKSENTANIGLGHNPADYQNQDLRRRLDRFLKEHCGDYRIEFKCGGLVPKFIGFDILGRDNLLLAGDAARTIDSLTGAGIGRALHTGLMSAQTIGEACSGNLSQKDLVSEYRQRVDSEIGRDLRFFSKAHKIFRKFGDEDWETVASFLKNVLSKQKAGSIDPATLVKSALTGAPQLARLTRHLF
jgi:digeranylgeranylglycerophospholipid reductase